MRRAVWELSPLILFALWLFGALPLIYSNGGPVNIVSAWSIDFVSAWKAISIVFTGAFGLMGLLTEFKNKETGRLTRWGMVSFGGIVLSAALGVIAQLKENTDESQRQK